MALETTILLLILAGVLFLLIRHGRRTPAAVRGHARPAPRRHGRRTKLD